MAAAGVLSPNFSIFINNDIVPLGGDFTIAAFGFQYQVSGVRIHRSASTGGGAGLTFNLRPNTVTGTPIASLAVPNGIGTYFVPLAAVAGDRNVETTDALFVQCLEAGPGVFEDIDYIVIDCIGRQGITPPILDTGVPALVIS